ncbi:hypothetical protein ACO0QE_001663 [Hanseniaspora vineae]
MSQLTKLEVAAQRFYHEQQASGDRTDRRKRSTSVAGITSISAVSKKSKSNEYTFPQISASVEEEIKTTIITEFPGIRDLQYVRPTDAIYFADLLSYKKKSECTEEEQKQRTVLKLLLRIKNGIPQNRKNAMKELVDKSVKLGVSSIMDKIFPILLDKALTEQERYFLVKFLDRLIFRMHSEIRPYLHKLFIVVSPLLLDEDETTRNLGYEVIASICKAVGPALIITTTRKDIASETKDVREVTARIIAISAKTIGPEHFIPFLNAMCHSTKKWENRHTGVRAVHNIILTMGISAAPYMNYFLQCLDGLLEDSNTGVRMLTANAIEALATACNPYGASLYEAFVLDSLTEGIRKHNGKLLAAFLKALSSIIPIMNQEYTAYYGNYIMPIIKREMSSPDQVVVKAVLLSLQKCLNAQGLLTVEKCKNEICPLFFKKFWTRRVALDLPLNKIVTYTTALLAKKVGLQFTMSELIYHLKDSSEPARLMTVYAIDKIFKEANDIEALSGAVESQLIDGLLIAFQDQKTDTVLFVRCFGTVASRLGARMAKYLPPIISTILNRLKNKTPLLRQLASDLCQKMVPECRKCGETEMLKKLNVVFYESLGEPYPEVLGSVLGCLDAIIFNTENLEDLQPPITQILPTLTPILRNVNPQVNQNILKLVDQIARRSADLIPPKEWMRVCNELLDMLKSPIKQVRIQANETFGNIAKSIGPQEILLSLLNNLKVQERQLRLCSSVAMAIVARNCGTYTVLPALMNEYKTPDIHVQNGVLKALAFLFEYIGPLSSDYVYLLAPLLQDALTDRDLVHRQTAATILKNIALSCKGAGNEDFFIHLLNLVIPNIFETSPHAVSRITNALDALRVALGPGIFMQYIWAGLFHPSRKVRKAYWIMYNSAYIQQADELVPFYPNFNDQLILELDYAL